MTHPMTCTPPNPEVEGWHWLEIIKTKELVAAQWDKGCWWTVGDDCRYRPENLAQDYTYVGPCHPPAAEPDEVVDALIEQLRICDPDANWTGVDGIMPRAAALIASLRARLAEVEKERDAATATERERCARIADSFTCGGCGMDGKCAAAIRSTESKP